MSDICDLCRKRKPVVKDLEVLGIKGFKPNVFLCDECIDRHKKCQAERELKKWSRRQMRLDSGDFP